MRSEINIVTVVGVGNMGRQIALECALNNVKAKIVDINETTLIQGKAYIEDYLAKQIAKNKLTEFEKNKVLSRIFSYSQLDEACEGTDLVIEAVMEKLEVKEELFKRLDQICEPHVILATNSSSILSSKLADFTKRPDKVLNIHFFNPVRKMELVEVVQNKETSQETAMKVAQFIKKINKHALFLKKEINGFVVNRILNAILKEACNLVEKDIVAPEELDIAVTKGLGHPMGPFRIMDMVGIDIAYTTRLFRFQESGDEFDRPPNILKSKFAKGEWGIKTGEGFYIYDKSQ